MKRVILLSCVVGLWLGVGAVAQEDPSVDKPKAAVVDIQELFREYYKTKKTQQEINVERARIQKDHNDMLGRLRSMDAGLKKLAGRLQTPGLSMDDQKTLAREKGLREQEREMLDRERRDTVVARHGELNQKMIVRMQNILEEIREIVAEKADGAGYDLVFDTAGLNSSQVPFLLFAKEATDLTPMILKELNKDSPPES